MCKDLIGKHDCSGYEGTAIVRGVDLARHSPLLQQQVPLAATSSQVVKIIGTSLENEEAGTGTMHSRAICLMLSCKFSST
jgi:hypothetical protein